MGKIVQIIDSLHDERLLFRICEVVGTYNNPFAPSSELIVGSNKFLSWEFDEWLPEFKDFVNLEKNHLRYGLHNIRQRLIQILHPHHIQEHTACGSILIRAR